ncbi:MAG: sigma-70 family RNA polymerase sigma factor [Candidatus Kapabacteria bacterium]|nr:sigma-70 family RNA polymerase sigma factor [Candidatus Kapabacteria bacterium]
MGHAFVAAYTDDTALIDDYLHGNREQAATAFVRRHQRFVYALALRQMNNNHDDADDAAQEVFIRALKALPEFKGDSSLQTWLYRITLNVCSSMRKKRKLLSWFSIHGEDEQFDVPSDSITPERALMESDFGERLQTLLQQLPQKQRETFCLRYFDELSYEEISAMVGTSTGALKANYFHALNKLAALINSTNLIDKGEYGYE